MPLNVQSVPVRVLPPRVPASLETWGLKVDRPLEASRSGAWQSQMVLDWESLLLRTDGGHLGSMAVPTLVATMLRPGVGLALTSLKEGLGITSCLSLVEAVEEGPESTRCKSVSGALLNPYLVAGWAAISENMQDWDLGVLSPSLLEAGSNEVDTGIARGGAELRDWWPDMVSSM